MPFRPAALPQTPRTARTPERKKTRRGIRLPRRVILFAVRADVRDVRYRAFLATSTMALNAAGSLTAMSESTLRSSWTPAFFSPFMNTE